MQTSMVLLMGEVKAVDDPLQIGRVKVYCDQIDSSLVSSADLPWCYYTSTSGGASAGSAGYGMWSPLQVGSKVVIGVLNGDSSMRCVLGCIWMPGSNKSLPSGTTLNNDKAGAEKTAADNVLKSETSVGYGEGGKVPQSYSWTTPGGNFIYMSDKSDGAKVRISTGGGSTISIDDSNSQIAIANAQGTASIRMNGDGTINVFGASDISFNTAGAFNVTSNSFNVSTNDCNVSAMSLKLTGESVDINACGNLTMSSCSSFNISSKSALSLYADSAVMVNKITFSTMVSSGGAGAPNQMSVANMNVTSPNPNGGVSQGTGSSMVPSVSFSEMKATCIGVQAAEAAEAGKPNAAPSF